MSRLGVLAVVMVCAAVASAPAGAQVLADEQGVAAPANPYTPPPCTTPVFNDVPCSNYFSAWINQLYNDQVSTGCPYPNFCPDQYVTRGQMSAFLERAMRGTANWSPGDLHNGNTGLGASALLHNSSYAEYNTAIGDQALYTQSFANGNAGYLALNTAVGHNALYSNQPSAPNNGTANTAVGVSSLANNTTGLFNVAVGVGAGQNYSTGTSDTFLGGWADAAADGFVDATAIGFDAVVDASYHVRIGDASVTQIGGQVGWSNLSDVRAKANIVPLDLGLDFVMALRPVSFTLKQGNGRTDMGFIAQDVEGLVGDGYNVLGIGTDKDRTLSLRYTDFIAPLVKAVQEQQAQIENQQATIATQQARVASLEAKLAEVERQKADIAALKAQVQALLAAQAGGATKTAK